MLVEISTGYLPNTTQTTLPLESIWWSYMYMQKKTKLLGLSPRANYTGWMAAACQRKLVPTFADRGCHVVSVTDPYGHILGFLDRWLYFFFPVAPQLFSRGWVDLVPNPLLLRKSGNAGNRTRTSGSVARNHYTTEAVVICICTNIERQARMAVFNANFSSKIREQGFVVSNIDKAAESCFGDSEVV
jgi:hypothetical protein